MKATRDYGPCTACKKPIKKGDDFAIKGGEFYHANCASGSAPAESSTPSAGESPPKSQPRRRSPAQGSGSAQAPESTTIATASKPKPRKRSPAQKPEPKAKPTKPPKLPRQQKATKKAKEPPAKPKPEPKAKTTPAATKKAKEKRGESACGMVVRLLCEQKWTDEEILKKVVASGSTRSEKSIKSAISINRSELNRGRFKLAREKFGLKDGATIERMVRVGRANVPASKAEAAQKKAAAGK